MPRVAVFATLAVLLAACGDGAAHEVTTPAVAASSHANPTGPSPASDTQPPSVDLPLGTPPAIDADVPAADLNPDSLVPAGMQPEGTWITSGPDAIVAAYASPADDAFRAERGVIVWRRFEDDPVWRPVYGRAVAGEEGVLGIEAIEADVTGDGRHDAVIRAATGGSGSCATWLVIDIEAAASVFERPLCDATVGPWSDPAGLRVERAVYRPGDPHCCPSAFRTTSLVYRGDGEWQVISTQTRDVS